MEQGDEIPFPYQAYPSQEALMRALYSAISDSKSGCFESPTGTGKSLSVICAAMFWQQQEEQRVIDQHQQEIDALAASSTSAASDDWLADILQTDSKGTEAAVKKKGEMERFQAMRARVAKANTKDESVSSTSIYSFGSHSRGAPGKTPSSSSSSSAAASSSGAGTDPSEDELDQEFVLPMYDSDDGMKTTSRRHKKRGDSDGVGDVGDDEDDDPLDDQEEETDLPLPKLFYCSRTHTQIAQFVTEIRRTCFAGARVVTLGSRKIMCIHPTVSKLGSDVRMSDQCLEMQKSSGKAKASTALQQQQMGGDGKKQKTVKTSTACAFHNRRLEEKFAEAALGRLRDIEELVTLGRELKACPYYATRRAVRHAQVICMPYNVLLHSDLRKSMGVNLEGSVVIFDEAHNLVDAVNHTHSAEITLAQLEAAGGAVATYVERFQYLLGGKNVYYINLLSSVIRKLRQSLKDMESRRLKEAANADANAAGDNSTILLSTNDYIFKAGLDNINLFKLKRHVTETNLVARIGGFAENQARKTAAAAAAAAAGGSAASTSNGKAKTSCEGCSPATKAAANAAGTAATQGNPSADAWTASQHALRSLLTLLTCLTNNDADGRVAMLSVAGSSSTSGAVNTSPPTAAANGERQLTVRFILLNPSVHFSKIVSSARSVILLGGTLRPFNFISSSLFAGMPPSRLSFFSCGHVVDKESVAAICLGQGPKGGTLEFTHGSRLNKSTTDELHGVLHMACQVVPKGIVVFLTSYSYMDSLVSTWRSSGQLSMLMRARGGVFVEPRAAGEGEGVWASYCTAARGDKGALLFCVMGGKLSEGINFSDDLARCVVVVGMPYPDMRDPILQEKLRHCDSLEAGSGKKVYEAMCMKSVNQSIGRSIRHINDYAAILLIDKRYSQPRVVSQLPSWIERSVRAASSCGEARADLEAFFAKKR